ncbi:winged helix-turn-helix domain-containing protein [Paenibacillus koleovorans]|uniref:winged helix-turn-helix domain-containing protein n=1 Tax=Paenibacillus koleovorans TaxID=121608 RepID=UPI000FDB72B2
MRDDTCIPLSMTQFVILRTLIDSFGSPVTSRDIIQSVWTYDETISDSNLYVYINRLRKKIEENPSRPKYLITIRGLGYLLNTIVANN